MSTRTYTSRRANILRALAEKLKDIDGSGAFLSDLQNNVHPRLKFWDEVVEFPAIHLNAGAETRQYQAGGYKDRFLAVTIRCYVQDEEDATDAVSWFQDADEDGSGTQLQTIESCYQIEGYVSSGEDCDDENMDHCEAEHCQHLQFLHTPL